MEKPTLKDTLRALAQDSSRRTKIGRLREVFPDIEAAQAAGVSNAKIVEALNAEHGLGLTLKTFETMLYRLRRQAAADQPAPRPSPAPLSRPNPHPAPTMPVAEADDATPHLTLRQRGEAVADQYMKPAATNPLLKKLTKEKK